MNQNIIVLSAEEVLDKAESNEATCGYRAQYTQEAFSIMRPLLQHFGAGSDWKEAKVVILVTTFCGCCGGNRAVNDAAKKLQSQGYKGLMLGRTVGDERSCDEYESAPNLSWCRRDSATTEQMIEQAEELASRPDQP